MVSKSKSKIRLRPARQASPDHDFLCFLCSNHILLFLPHPVFSLQDLCTHCHFCLYFLLIVTLQNSYPISKPHSQTLIKQRQTLISSNISLIRLVLPDLPVHIPVGFLLSALCIPRIWTNKFIKTCIYSITKKKSFTALKILCSSCSFCSHL